MMEDPPLKIYYFFQMDQPIYSVMKREIPIPIEFIKNMPSDEILEDIINSPLKSKLICLDDFGMLNCSL